MGGLFTQSFNHLFGWLGIQSQSVSQSVCLLVNQSICPLVSQSVCQSVQLVSLSVSRSVCLSVIRSDEGLILETSTVETRYGGLLTLSTQLIKPSYLVTPPPNPRPSRPSPHCSFFGNLPSLFVCLSVDQLVIQIVRQSFGQSSRYYSTGFGPLIPASLE